MDAQTLVVMVASTCAKSVEAITRSALAISEGAARWQYRQWRCGFKLRLPTGIGSTLQTKTFQSQSLHNRPLSTAPP